MTDKAWPAGEPNEAEIRARIAHRLEKIDVTITRGDLENLDKVITFVNAMADLFSADFYDDLWNLRNGMVAFQPGDKHYDAEEDEEETAP